MQAMIFAAGLGTRLKPLTDTKPKALVEVGGKPLLWHVIHRLRQAGFGRIVINVHHFASQIVDYVHAHDDFGLDIRISNEQETLLDTGGGIRHAAPLFDADSPVLIHNVDILSSVDLKQLYEAAGDADAALLVSERTTKRYLLFDADDALCFVRIRYVYITKLLHRFQVSVFENGVGAFVFLASPVKLNTFTGDFHHIILSHFLYFSIISLCRT